MSKDLESTEIKNLLEQQTLLLSEFMIKLSAIEKILKDKNIISGTELETESTEIVNKVSKLIAEKLSDNTIQNKETNG